MKALKCSAVCVFALLHLCVLTASAEEGVGRGGVRADSFLVGKLRAEGVTFSRDNNVTLLMRGQEKFDDMFAAIRQARSTVHLEYFNFRNDSIAMLLFDILAEKAREGVKVRALYDAFGNASNNQPLRRRHIKALRKRGIEIYEFDPLRFPWLNHIFGRDHRKIVVIDGQVAYTGGMNVADYYIKGTPQVGSWRDMHCRLEGTEVAELQRIFLRAWKKVTGQDISPEPVAEHKFAGLLDRHNATAGEMLVGVVNREPHLTPKATRLFYRQAIDAARDTIRIINPYFTLIPQIRRALLRAIRRGVEVEIMLPEHSDIPLTPDCAFYTANRLRKRGCRVWLYRPGFHHTKVIMVDDLFTTVGSTNLDARSLRCDYECNLAVVDTVVTRQLSDMFERDKRDSFELTAGVYRQWRTPWQRFRAWFSHLLAPWL